MLLKDAKNREDQRTQKNNPFSLKINPIRGRITTPGLRQQIALKVYYAMFSAVMQAPFAKNEIYLVRCNRSFGRFARLGAFQGSGEALASLAARNNFLPTEGLRAIFPRCPSRHGLGQLNESKRRSSFRHN